MKICRLSRLKIRLRFWCMVLFGRRIRIGRTYTGAYALRTDERFCGMYTAAAYDGQMHRILLRRADSMEFLVLYGDSAAFRRGVCAERISRFELPESVEVTVKRYAANGGIDAVTQEVEAQALKKRYPRMAHMFVW